jgi:hypothetical protein
MPLYKVAKRLNTILNHNLHLDNQYTVTNSNTLANYVTKVKVTPNSRLLNLDIKDLYVNIPMSEIINITKTQLLKNNDIHTTNQIITLLKIILKQDYFPFQGQIYQPDKGVAMGSPVSGTMTEIFLKHLENDHIKHLIESKYPNFLHQIRGRHPVSLLYHTHHTRYHTAVLRHHPQQHPAQPNS